MAYVTDIFYEDRLNQSTGQIESVRVSRSYYTKDSLKKINFKGNFMNYMDALEQICRTSKDIGIIKVVLSDANDKNEIVLYMNDAIKRSGLQRRSFLALLHRAVKAELLMKTGDSSYTINPFMFVSIAMSRKAANAFQAQEDWLLHHP